MPIKPKAVTRAANTLYAWAASDRNTIEARQYLKDEDATSVLIEVVADLIQLTEAHEPNVDWELIVRSARRRYEDRLDADSVAQKYTDYHRQYTPLAA